MRIRIRIEKVFGTFYHEGFDKLEVLAMVYMNGKPQYKRLFFNSAAQAESVKEGAWMDY